MAPTHKAMHFWSRMLFVTNIKNNHLFGGFIMDHEVTSEEVAQQFSRDFSVLFKWLDHELAPPQVRAALICKCLVLRAY